jgi:uncharacterized protein
MSESSPLDLLEGHRYFRLTSFRKSGKAVPRTVWFALVDGKAYVFTSADSGKAKRIRNNTRVTLTPATSGASPK